MFYQEKEINVIIACPLCSEKFNDPRILPCGESVCNECIQNKMNNKTNLKISCTFCQDVHDIPVNGFSKNHRLTKLIAIKPDEVYRGKMTGEFKSYLNLIDDKVRHIENDLKMGREKIKEYCDFIRSDVDLIAESWTQYIHKYRMEFLKKIDNYEDDCLTHYAKLNENKESFETLINEANKFHASWTEYLNEFSVDKSKIIEASAQARMLIQNLTFKEKDIKTKIFNGKLLKFEKNDYEMTSNVIGQLKYQNIKLNFDQLNESRVVCMRNNLNEFNNRFKIVVEPLLSGNFVLVHQTTSNNVNIMRVDKLGNILCQFDSIVPIPASSSLIYDIKLVKIKDDLYVYIWHYNINQGHRFNLICFDLNLKIKNKVYHDYPINSFAAYDTCIYVLSNQNNANKLSIYDSNLENTQIIGQKNRNLPYFFPLSIKKIEVNQKFYFILDSKSEVKLMNRSDGLITKTFKINSNDFLLYMDQHIISFDSHSRMFYLYDFEGKLKSEHDLNNVTSCNQLIGVSEDELILYDSNQVSLQYLFH